MGPGRSARRCDNRSLHRLPRPLGAGIGVLLDRLLGEPPTAVHPVVLFGRAMGSVEHEFTKTSAWPVAPRRNRHGLGRHVWRGWSGRRPSPQKLPSVAGLLPRAATDVGDALAEGDDVRARELLPTSGRQGPRRARRWRNSSGCSGVGGGEHGGCCGRPCCCGPPWPEPPGRLGTGPSTPWTPWSGIVPRAT